MKTDAEDVTQTVLLRLYESEKELSTEDHRKNWLVREGKLGRFFSEMGTVLFSGIFNSGKKNRPQFR